jgi:hypothetical protein
MVRRMFVAVAVMVAALSVGGAISARPAQALVVGIGDQKADMFGDPLFRSLGIRHARLAVPWDVLTVRWQRDELDGWLAAARSAGVEPLVGFGHSRVHRRSLPTPERFRYEFRRFRQRYPWVRTFATWNEANHCGEPTCHRPQLVAAYFRALRRECETCRVAAAEVLDMPNMVSWVNAFQRHLRYRPQLWGLHNYVDANRLRTTGTSALLRVTRGQIWFTETGGIVRRRNRAKVGFPESAAHAAKATRWVFDRLVPLSDRIKRVYLYHWNTSSTPENWDSALVNHRGRPRPALTVVRRELWLAAQRRAARADGSISRDSRAPSGPPRSG